MENSGVQKEKPSRAEQIRRLKQVVADEDKYFPGVLGNPVMVAARWGLPLSKGYHYKVSNQLPPALKMESLPLVEPVRPKPRNRIRVRLPALNPRAINQSSRTIVKFAKRTGGPVTGPAAEAPGIL